MKCLIVGNSHATALQLALREGWSQPGLQIDIIVIPGRTQPDMRIVDGHILPAKRIISARSNISPFPPQGLALADYQAVWLVGYGLNGPSKLTLADSSHAFARACHGVGAVNLGVADGLAVPQVSRHVMTEILVHDLNRSGFLPLLRSLTEQGGALLRVVPRPRPAAYLLTTAAAELRALYGDHAEAALRPYFTLHDEVVASLVGTMAQILWQRPETTEGPLTAALFSQPADFTHMNSAYGRIVLDQLAASMQG